MRIFYDENHQQWKLHLTWDKAEQIAARCERPDSAPEDRKYFDLFNLTNKEQIEGDSGGACRSRMDTTRMVKVFRLSMLGGHKAIYRRLCYTDRHESSFSPPD